MTLQADTWSGAFGETYTKRNTRTLDDLDDLMKSTLGVTRSELNEEFLGDLDRDISILEVGCNIGNQLALLHKMGFTNLHGVDVQSFALEHAAKRCPFATLQRASALELPFADRHFDLVFTAGVLIHIAPEDLPIAMTEITRCAKSFVWGYEFYADSIREVEYRGHNELHWNGDYVAQFLDIDDEFNATKVRQLPWLQGNNIDIMFRLERQS